MRLSALLMHWKKKPPPGHLFRGKNRIVPEPTIGALFKLRYDFERTERNMLILRHPFLTPEQSHGHAKSFKTPIRSAEVYNKKRNARFNRHFTWNDQLCHLLTTEGWE
ncbi:uncharacterized protein [Chelonus insularis]|uniref:uncharacterized protein n=1 Tax=Chelonus insularis TaxID=460826 RepID=UPI001588D3ED|nr:uncharacterized protein LOC118065504 [Chelonus insularis]